MQTTDSNSFEMNFNQPSNFYEVLELSPDASPEQIREAYHRIKAAYRKDSVALYTLLNENDTVALLERVEEAYQTLSNPEKRKIYDSNYQNAAPSSTPLPSSKVVSIDRVPPMDTGFSSNDLFVPPATDFNVDRALQSPTTDIQSSYDPFSAPPQESRTYTSSASTTTEGTGKIKRPKNLQNQIDHEIAAETEFTGGFLRKVREARGVSIDEMMEFTKLSKRYISGIEEEDYAKLPAPVFIRGFVNQMARYLKLPHDKVVQAYMDRYQRSKTGKT